MGTTVSVAVRPPLVANEVLDAFFDQLRDVDARFSTYRADSEVSRLARGELAEADASPDLRHVLAACDHLAVVTDGAFDARRHRPDGRPDPSGFVKGWAIEEAAWLLDSAGARNYWINAGGDIVARGEAALAGRGGSESGTPTGRIGWPPSWRSPTGPSRPRAATSAAITSAIRAPRLERWPACAASPWSGRRSRSPMPTPPRSSSWASRGCAG